MGFAATWCAVREEHAAQFLHQLRLSPTGETEDFPESLISMAKLNTGWRVIWYNEYDCPFLRPHDLAQLSNDKDVLLCLVEEHVMATSVEMWSRGQRKWWLSHAGENGPKGLATDGEPPAPFPAIRKEMEEAQRTAGGDDAGVDYIADIPLLLAKALVGFKHDDDNRQVLPGPYIILSRNDPPQKNAGLLRRLFAKK